MQERKSGERVKGRSRRQGNQPTSLNPAAGNGTTGNRTRTGAGRISGANAGTEGRTATSSNITAGAGTAAGKTRTAIITGCVALGLMAASGAAYTYMGQQYQQVFFPRTTVNGMDVSGKSVEEVKQMIAAGIEGYTLTLEPRGGGAEVIRGTEIGLHPEYDGALEAILDAQEPLRWGIDAMEQKEYTIGTMMAYDRQKLETAVSALPSLDPENMTKPVDARISDYTEGMGYEIVPEERGNLLKQDVVMAGVEEAIQNMSGKLVLEELDAYVKPEVTADDPELAAQVETWNRLTQMTVTYRFGRSTEVLDGDTIHQWLQDDGRGGVALDKEQVVEYVKQMARKYNTAYQPKELKTSYGPTVKIVGGPYGWRINQSAEVDALMEILRSGQSQERKPVYSQKAASHDGPDYGDTYVEINLTAQHLYFYKDGRLVVESDLVSGNASRGWSTPAGAYPLTYKERNATLKGENYATPVSYWMPFNGNIGMHDAEWRSSFGGTLYKTSGSHGCVNLPPSVAKTIYENISAGMPVLCYELDGTEQKTAGGTKPAGTKPAQTQPAEKAPAQPQPAETAPAQTQPAETKPTETQPTETTQADSQSSGSPVYQPSGDGTPTGGASAVPNQNSNSGSVSGPAGPGGSAERPSSGVVSGPGQ